MKGKGQGWHDEPTRHRMSRYGYKTVLPDGRRFHMRDFVASGYNMQSYWDKEEFLIYNNLSFENISKVAIYLGADTLFESDVKYVYNSKIKPLTKDKRTFQEWINDRGYNDVDWISIYNQKVQDIADEMGADTYVDKWGGWNIKKNDEEIGSDSSGVFAWYVYEADLRNRIEELGVK